MPEFSGQGGQKVEISRETWAQYKETIEDLYVTKVLPLSEVRQHLEIQGFSASIPQYKRKLNEWGFAKNLKASDCRAISSSLDRRGLTYDTAKAVVRGRIVKPAQLQRALRRHTVSTWQRKRNQGELYPRRSPTPDEVEVQRIPASPSNLGIEPAVHRTQTNPEQLVPPLGRASPTLAFLDALTVDASVPSSRSLDPPSAELETPILAQLSPPSLAHRQPYAADSRIPDTVSSGATFDSLRQLLENETNVDEINKLLQSELHHAARSQDTRMVQFLLENGASPQGFTTSYNNEAAPLSIAAGNSNLEMCAILLEAGADAKAVDGFAKTALHYAVASQSVPIVRLLLDYGALSWPLRENTADDSINLTHKHLEPLDLADTNSELYEVLLEAAASYLWRYTKLSCTTLKHELDPLLSLTYTMPDVLLIPVSCCFERALQLAVCCPKFRFLKLLLRQANFQSLSQITSPLFVATWKGYEPALEILMRHGVSMNAYHVCEFGTFDLVQAASFKGHLEEAMPLLMSHRVDVNGAARGLRGRTALQHAVEKGDRKMINFLLKHGADVNAAAAEKQGLTALQAAALSGEVGLVSLLLQRGAVINALPAREGGYTALSGAISSRSHIIFRRLIQAGADINLLEWEQCDHLNLHLLVAIRIGALDFVQESLDFGLDLLATLRNGQNLAEFALLEARRYRRLQILRLILDRSSSIRGSVMNIVCNSLVLDEANENSIQFPDESASNMLGVDAPIFERALRAGCFELVDYLKKHWAQVTQTFNNPENRSAFASACKNGELRVCQLMLQYGARVDAPISSTQGQTALLAACERGAFALAQMLIEYGADVNASQSDWPYREKTPLHYICRKEILDASKAMPLVNMLLDCGADVNAPLAFFGKSTPLQEACYRGHVKVVEALLRHDADVNASPSGMGYTALQAAAIRGNIEIVQLLLAAGVNVAAAPHRGRTAIGWAATEGHLEVLKLLVQHWPSTMLKELLHALDEAIGCAERGVHRDVMQYLATLRLRYRHELPKESHKRSAVRRASISIMDSEEDSEDDDEDE